MKENESKAPGLSNQSSKIGTSRRTLFPFSHDLLSREEEAIVQVKFTLVKAIEAEYDVEEADKKYREAVAHEKRLKEELEAARAATEDAHGFRVNAKKAKDDLEKGPMENLHGLLFKDLKITD